MSHIGVIHTTSIGRLGLHLNSQDKRRLVNVIAERTG